MIAYSYSAWTTDSLKLYKSDSTQIFNISTPIFNSYVRAYLQEVDHEWLQILAQHERPFLKWASRCINRQANRF